MTDELAERIADALELIAFNLGEDGMLVEQLSLIWERLDEITPEGHGGRRYLRTLDVGRD
jgi:hypothetical protein